MSVIDRYSIDTRKMFHDFFVKHINPNINLFVLDCSFRNLKELAIHNTFVCHRDSLTFEYEYSKEKTEQQYSEMYCYKYLLNKIAKEIFTLDDRLCTVYITISAEIPFNIDHRDHDIHKYRYFNIFSRIKFSIELYDTIIQCNSNSKFTRNLIYSYRQSYGKVNDKFKNEDAAGNFTINGKVPFVAYNTFRYRDYHQVYKHYLHILGTITGCEINAEPNVSIRDAIERLQKNYLYSETLDKFYNFIIHQGLDLNDINNDDELFINLSFNNG